MNDTSIEAEAVQMRIFRAMPPARRLALANGWSETLRSLLRSKLVGENRNASEARLHRLFADRWLGVQLADKVYGPQDFHG